MISSLDHFSSFDHDDIIGMSHGLEPVSDDDNSSSLEERIESLSDSFLTEWIERTCGFVEKDDIRIFEKYLGDSKTLLLSSWEPHSSLSNLGVESLLHLKDEVTVGKTEGFQ